MSDEKTPHIRICKWDDLQHYKDRNPPWIKLYNRLLDSHRWGRLPDASKGHYTGLLMLASREENRIPLDVDWIAGRIAAREPLDLRPLVNAGLISVYHRDSEPLAQGTRDGRRELDLRGRGRDRGEGETEGAEGSSLRSSPSEPDGSLDDDPGEEGEPWNDRIAESLREHAYPDGEPEGSWTIGQDLSIARQLIEAGYSVTHLEDAIEAVRMMVDAKHSAVRDWIEPGGQFTLRVLNRQDERGQKLVQVAPNYLYKHGPTGQTAEAVAR